MKMIEYSEKLSAEIPFVRVDWYEIGGQPIFSELTFTPAGGFMRFHSKEYLYDMGRQLKLPEPIKKSNMYNYSVIIPHKNCVNLLFRCLDSIPRRKDIQVIVVDDVSSFSKGEKQQLLDKQDSNIKIVFLEKTHFAGGARNEGISLSEGKWLVFADSDDFFTKGAFDVMDQYLMSESDIVFFGDTSCYSDTLEPTNRYGQRMKWWRIFVVISRMNHQSF